MENNRDNLIYLDKNGNEWIQKHTIGNYHPEDAEFYCEIPSEESKKWISGSPEINNIQFLTLSPFYRNLK